MSKKLLIPLAAVTVMVLVGMGIGLWVMWTKVSAIDAGGKKKTQKKAEVQKSAPAIGPMYALETFIVNLADRSKERYLRVTMNLELSSPALAEEIEKRLPQVRNLILMILPAKTYEDVITAEGKIALRDQIIAKLNEVVTSGKVTNLYFTEFVVQ